MNRILCFCDVVSSCVSKLNKAALCMVTRPWLMRLRIQVQIIPLASVHFWWLAVRIKLLLTPAVWQACLSSTIQVFRVLNVLSYVTENTGLFHAGFWLGRTLTLITKCYRKSILWIDMYLAPKFTVLGFLLPLCSLLSWKWVPLTMSITLNINHKTPSLEISFKSVQDIMVHMSP